MDYTSEQNIDHSNDYSHLDSFLYDQQDQTDPLENAYAVPTAICGVIMSVVACVGIVGNAVTAYIFSRRTMGKTSIGVLLVGLAVTDALLLIVAAPLFAASAIYVYGPSVKLMNFISYMTVFAYPVASALQTASVWLMTVITMERFVAVCKPFLARTWCTRTRARRIMAAVVVTAVLYNVCRFWEYTLTSMDTEASKSKKPTEVAKENFTDYNGYYEIEDMIEKNALQNRAQKNEVVAALPAKLRESENYILVYIHWMYFIFIFATPFVVLSIVNVMVVITIRRARRDRRQLTRQQRKEHDAASMMVVVTCAYLLCTSLAFVLNAMELWGVSEPQEVPLPQLDMHAFVDALQHEDLSIANNTGLLELRNSILRMAQEIDTNGNVKKTTRRHSDLFYFLIDVNNLLVMLHCSVNFFIYYKFSQRFRSHVRAISFRQSQIKRAVGDSFQRECTVENRTYRGYDKEPESRKFSLITQELSASNGHVGLGRSGTFPRSSTENFHNGLTLSPATASTNITSEYGKITKSCEDEIIETLQVTIRRGTAL